MVNFLVAFPVILEEKADVVSFAPVSGIGNGSCRF